MASKLRAVNASDAPPPKKPQATTLKDAAENSERELLVLMRSNISDTIGAGVPAHTLAPLMRQMREIDKEIRTLDARAAQEVSSGAKPVDNSYDASAI